MTSAVMVDIVFSIQPSSSCSVQKQVCYSDACWSSGAANCAMVAAWTLARSHVASRSCEPLVCTLRVRRISTLCNASAHTMTCSGCPVEPVSMCDACGSRALCSVAVPHSCTHHELLNGMICYQKDQMFTPNIYQNSNLRFGLKSEIWAVGDVTTMNLRL